jgi:hypothetical protein
MFVAIDFALVREAKVHGVEADQLMTNVLRPLLRPLGGVFSAHLGRNPQVCVERMTDLLKSRLDKVKCPKWGALLRAATGGNNSVDENLHIPNCPLCLRDIAQIKAKLPFYGEFSR